MAPGSLGNIARLQVAVASVALLLCGGAHAREGELKQVEERKLSLGIEGGPGLAESRLGPLNRLLAADGFATVSSTRMIGALDAVVEVWRLRFALQLQGGRATARHQTSGAEFATGLTRGALTAGLQVLRYRNATFWAATGIGGGTLGFDGRTAGFTAFESQLQSWERGRVNFEHAFVPVELGSDYLVPLGAFSADETYALLFGVRVGYAFQTGGSWSTEVDGESRDLNGPKLDLSGPHYRLVLGITLF